MNRPVRRTAPRSRLQRLRNALAEHNWLSVVIEILIVTVGVLLAFEIQQWGEARQRANEERQFLERLYREYDRAAEELNFVIVRNHDKVINDFRKAFAARGDRRLLERYSSTPNFGCGGGYLRSTPFSDTAFQEIVSSGRVSIVSNPDLRAAIRDLTTEQASLRDRAGRGTDDAREQSNKLEAYYRYELLPDGTTRCFADWPGLLDNPSAVNAAVRVYRMHEFVREGRLNLLRMTKDVRADVGCELGKPTCRR